MKKQSALILIGLVVLLVTSGQINLKRLWAMTDDAHSERAFAQDATISGNPQANFLTGPNSGDPLDIALTYLYKEAGKLGLNAEDLADIVVTDRFVTQQNGVTHLYLRQRYHGIEVFNGVININISRSGEVINLGNRFVPNLAKAVNTDSAILPAMAAVEYAARHLNLQLTAPLSVLEDRNGAAHEMYLSPAGISKKTIPVNLVYQRQPDSKLRLAWSLTIEPSHEPSAKPHSWHLRVDAVNGAILAQGDLILNDQWDLPATVTVNKEQQSLAESVINTEQPPSPLTQPVYRVFPLPLENPEDGPGLPDSQVLVADPADEVASPYGWHDIDGLSGHDFTDTRGNNVFAQEDRNDDDNDGFRPTGTEPLNFNFDYPFDPSLNPTEGDNTAAIIVNLFYWDNILHDIAYRYGFDEVSGNFQQNSYDRGGLGGDALQADAQDAYDWGARNNAYFAITPDGYPPRMGMYVFDYTVPNRDSALDNGIVIHEYAHGISTRLVGGSSSPYCLYNAEQMGEGWSDWFTLALTTQASDTGAKSRGLGTYVLGQPADGPGIRVYPYSTDMSINPFTYEDVKTSTGDIYVVGQIWASMLWEMQWNLIEQHGFDPDFYTGTGGNNLALRLVMDGMKFAPCDPGFVDARNALLTADQIDNEGANQCIIWQAFAKRGLGASADQGSPYDINDGHSAFDLPIACLDELMLTKTADPPIAEAGHLLTYQLVVANYLADPLTDLTLSDPIPVGTTYVDGSASEGGTLINGVVTWQLADLNPDEAVTRTFQVMVDRNLAIGTLLTNSATVRALTGESDSFTIETPVVSLPDIEVSTTGFEETLLGGNQLTREFTISNVGPGPLEFEIVEYNLSPESPLPTPISISLQPADLSATGRELAKQDSPTYAGDYLLAKETERQPLKMNGLSSQASIDVLLLAAADISQIQEILGGYPDLGLLDSFDARFATPSLEQLLAYDTVIVISNNSFADAVAVGNLLADYVDASGTVIQTTPTFYDAYGYGWGLRGRFIDAGYSPFVGTGDKFSFAELGDFDANHPIMQGVTYAGDSMRQVVDLTDGAQWVASWTDDEFIATKGKVVALNTFLADYYYWTGDIPLIVHNSIVWLQSQGELDAPWLSATPITGTLTDGESQVINLTFDAGAAAVQHAGDYAAMLRVLSNDPYDSLIEIPITMHVVGPELSIFDTSSYFGRKATVPVSFMSKGLNIAAIAFSVDFDERCLRFDTTDANNNGIPDAIKLLTPPGIELMVSVDTSDLNGELDIFVADLTPPLAALPEGTLLTIDWTVLCQPEKIVSPVRVGFGTMPSLSFGDLNGVAIPGLGIEGTLEILPGLPGDCNRDGLVNAADAVSCVLEIFDGDGSFWLDAPGGTFPGSPQGCDSNLDEQIDAGDLLCTVLTIFHGQGACNVTVGAASSAAVGVAVLAIPDEISTQPGDTVSVPVFLTGNGNTTGAAVFALTFDPAVLTLDPTDSDSNGIPDAIRFNLPAGLVTSVMVVDNQHIQVAIADLSLPFVALPDGPLANITFTVNSPSDGQSQTTTISFAGDMPASLGTHDGQSAAVETKDGSVLITVTQPADEPMETIYLPMVAR